MKYKMGLFFCLNLIYAFCNAKAIFVEEQEWYYFTHNGGEGGVYFFRKYQSESQRNRITGVRIRLIQGCSSAL